MGTIGLILLWAVCIFVGAVIGLVVGYVIWQLGFELIGGAIALVGGAIGGIAAFFGLLAWYDRRERPRRANS